ncbi:site-specific integrase [Micromonospora sp. NPDC049891]|uniref:tyrosine-type recombinase/integrase n=1 Tax=Micromonospora sp. NPDC049891 TaxID=3155655 RepID=UPI0033EF1B3D
MGRRALGLGETGEVEITPQRQVDGRWVRAEPGVRPERYRARVYVRCMDGIRREVTATARTKAEVNRQVQDRVQERLQGHATAGLTLATPLVDAGRHWLGLMARSDSGLSPRSISDYSGSWKRHVESRGSAIRGLTLGQANDPQRLRGFLQQVADRQGTGAAKMVRSVLAGVLGQAVDDGVLTSNAIRQVRPVKSQVEREDERDRTRAFTRAERDSVIAYADAQVLRPSLDPRSVRKAQVTADLVAFMAGTGVRIDEARMLRWEHVDLDAGWADVHGTKSRSARRRLTLPGWLVDRLRARQERLGSVGYLLSTPAHVRSSESPWDRSNSATAVRRVLDGAGFPWAVPHTFRRTVATLLHEAGVPVARIADQLGHSDPAMTASVYLGRDFTGPRDDVAALL